MLSLRGEQLAEEIFVGSHGRLKNLETRRAVKMRKEVLGKGRQLFELEFFLLLRSDGEAPVHLLFKLYRLTNIIANCT